MYFQEKNNKYILNTKPAVLAHFYQTDNTYLIHVTRDPYEYGCHLSHTHLLDVHCPESRCRWSGAALGINIKSPIKTGASVCRGWRPQQLHHVLQLFAEVRSSEAQEAIIQDGGNKNLQMASHDVTFTSLGPWWPVHWHCSVAMLHA